MKKLIFLSTMVLAGTVAFAQTGSAPANNKTVTITSANNSADKEILANNKKADDKKGNDAKSAIESSKMSYSNTIFRPTTEQKATQERPGEKYQLKKDN